MPNFLKPFFNQISASFKRFPPERRLSMVVVTALMVTACIVLIIWAFKPQYKLLYSDLALDDSGEIVEILKSEKIPFRIEAEGSRILIPADKVYETRLKLAAKELPGERGTGWEIFDKPSLGVTDFVQKLNYRRGLEGELGRTILQLDPVEAVRVHLVMPDESLFRETQKEPMASVTLRLKGGQYLARNQVEGIRYMVGSAVEGLNLENVTVIDSKGFVLSDRKDSDPLMRLTATQLDLQNQIEAKLIEKGQDLLNKRFGKGRSAIQVTAKLDFNTEELTREMFDADNPSVRSEEISSNTSTAPDTSSSSNESSITNYELNLTRERHVKPVGEIERLTIAVMVDGNYDVVIDSATGKEKREFVPFDAGELNDVTTTIQLALGFDSQRGDQITVTSVPFQEVEMVEVKEMITLNRWDLLYKYGQKIATFVALILLLLFVRGFVKKAEESVGSMAMKEREQLGVGELSEKEALPPPSLDLDLSPEAKSEDLLQKQIGKFVVDNPSKAAKLIKSWMVE